MYPLNNSQYTYGYPILANKFWYLNEQLTVLNSYLNKITKQSQCDVLTTAEKNIYSNTFCDTQRRLEQYIILW